MDEVYLPAIDALPKVDSAWFGRPHVAFDSSWTEIIWLTIETLETASLSEEAFQIMHICLSAYRCDYPGTGDLR